MLRPFLIVATLALANGCGSTVATLSFPLEVVTAAITMEPGATSHEGGTVRHHVRHPLGCGTSAALTALFTLGFFRSGDGSTTEVELEAVPGGTRVAVTCTHRGWFFWILPFVSRQRSLEAACIDRLAERVANESLFPKPVQPPQGSCTAP